jgi:hypothetical protein
MTFVNENNDEEYGDNLFAKKPSPNEAYDFLDEGFTFDKHDEDTQLLFSNQTYSNKYLSNDNIEYAKKS